MDPDVKDYTVEKLIPYEPYEKDKETQADKYKSSNHASNAGPWGRTKDEIMTDIFNLYDADVQSKYKLEWKELKDMTLGEVEKKMNFKLNRQWKNIDDRKFLFPMIAGLHRFSWNAGAGYPTKVLSSTKAEEKIYIKCDIDKSYTSSILDEFLRSKLGLSAKEAEGLKLPYDFSIEGDGIFELTQNAIMAFKFEAVLPKEYKYQENKMARDVTDDMKKDIDKILSVVNSNIDEVNNIFSEYIKKRFDSENVKIDIK